MFRRKIIFTVPIEKEVTRIDKKNLQKIYLTYFDLLTAQDLWQAYYQILSITFLKEFIKLNVNSDMIIKNAEHVELHIKIATAFLNTHILKII